MGVFKEITKADGSGVTVFYRTNLASTFDISDLDIDTESVLYRTGEEISQMTEDKPYIVLCTEDYIYTDQYGSLISVERGTVYEMEHGTVVDAISIGGGGGGGGVPRSNLSTANSPLEQNVSIKATVNLSIHFLTTALKKTGTVKLYVNNVMKSTKTVESGEDCEFDVSKYLKLGSNYFTIRSSDDNGAEKSFDFLINAVQLVLSSGFNGNIPIPNTFDYTYRIKGAGEKTVHFILDDVETTITTTTSDVDLTQTFTNLSHGAHNLVVYASAELEGEEMFSNELTYSLLTYNPASSDPIMLSNFDVETSMEGEQLKIDYLVYDPSTILANVSMYINNEWVMDTAADRTLHYWNVSNYPTGTVTFKITCGTASIEKTVEVEPISVDIQEATEGLELKLTAANRSNQELEPGRSTWHYNDIYCQMNNFNWQSNGWIDGRLKLTGKANVVIPFQPFATDLRRTGKTIEVEFITYNAFNSASKLISCIDDDGVGFDVTLDKSILASEQESVSTQFGEGTKIRISFVIESTSSNRLIKTYINGVLSGLKQYAVDDNFQQAVPTNITINPNEEEIDITSIRIYNRALNSKELVNNWIYDKTDISEKIDAFNKNQIYDYYGNISYTKVKNFLPVVIVTGPMPTYKGDKKKVKVTYEHNLKTNYNFEQENCTIDVQGTSSQYYPRKNWKIKLADKVQVDDGWLEEKTYCMKADFMESSHTYNIGTATLINDIYDPEDYYPTRTAENGVRDTVNGFPCVLFTKESDDAEMYFAGTFMFNNDKADTDTLGYTIDPDYKNTSESWEFKNNTSDHCLFRSDDFSPAASPLDDFEARYPDGYEDFTALSRVFSWVVSCRNNPTKFKQEFEQYFNLHYCLVYQVMLEVAIMVDSRAKNMFLDTADGIIWYPRFYDMDTCWGLNNEGVPAWSYGVEIHDRVGSAYVWDDRGASEFWNLFEQAYSSEIKAMYHTLREEKLTYENILHYYVENISSQFSASEYNEDSEFKYVGPLVDEGNATYLYAAQGNRQDYFRWIVKKRLYYLDSKYEYGDYNNDYATMRWYTLNGNITLTTYQDLYVKIRFGSTDVKTRIKANTPTEILAPPGLEFNDTEVIIWGASQIISFGDLTNKYAGTVDVSKCEKLQELRLCDTGYTNTNLVSLSLGNNPLLRTINVTNCSSLGGNLDLSSCSDLRNLKAQGTQLTGFILPEGSVIEELHLPDTITSLTFKNLSNLTVFDAHSCQNVKTLVFEKTDYPLLDILSRCGGLSRLRVVFDDNYTDTLDIDIFMYYYNNLLGVDEHGYNLPHPAFVGTLNLEIQDYHTLEEETNYKNTILSDYPNLSVNYINITSKFSTYYYFYKGSYPATYVYEFREDGLLNRKTPPVDNPYYPTYNQSYAAPQDNPPAGTLFMTLCVKADTRDLLFIPEQIRSVPVYGFCVPDYTAQQNITGIIIGGTNCRMFEISFYEEYQLIGGPSYYNYPQLSVSSVSSTDPDVFYVSGSALTGAGYRNMTSSKQVYGLRSLAYKGNITIMPSFAGNYLTEFPSTANVTYMAPLYYTIAQMELPNPLLPFNLRKLKTINGPLANIPTDVELPDLSTLTVTGRMYNTYDADSFDCNWYMAKSFGLASYTTLNNLNLRGRVGDLSSIGGNLTVRNSFDGTGVTQISNRVLTLPWNSFDNPLYVPDLINIYTQPGNVLYLDCPKLENIRSTTWAERWECHFMNTTRSLKMTNPGHSGQQSFGWNAYNAADPWMEYGIDCSNFDEDRDNYTSFELRFCNSGKSGEEITSFGGLINYGQAFTSSNHSLSILDFNNCTNPTVAHNVVMNIINNLYDITQLGGTRNYRIGFGSNLKAALNLTAEEIAVATNKGWTLNL